MTKEEIAGLIDRLFSKEQPAWDHPIAEDWSFLHHKFQCDFSDDFVTFMDVVCEYSFPGELLNVVMTGRTNGNDTISLVYDHESEHHNWPAQLIPFYAVGNGDYYCLDSREGKRSKVYYRYYDDSPTSVENTSFGEWIENLPSFLG